MSDDKGKGGDDRGHGHQVKITIDKKELKSPDPTTGAALNLLGHVQAGYDLFREVRGRGDDQKIPNDATKIDLKEHDVFYSVQGSLNPGALHG